MMPRRARRAALGAFSPRSATLTYAGLLGRACGALAAGVLFLAALGMVVFVAFAWLTGCGELPEAATCLWVGL